MSDEPPTPPPERPKKRDGRADGRASKLEVEQRVGLVLQVLTMGSGFAGVQQLNTAKGWRLGWRRLREYMRLAREILLEQAAERRAGALEVALARREHLYLLALKADQLKVAADVLKDSAELEGLYPPKATTAEVNLNSMVKGSPISDTQLDKILGDRA